MNDLQKQRFKVPEDNILKHSFESDNKSNTNFNRVLNNPKIAALPNHLKQFIVDQNFTAYTALDHSVWRYVLRQNHRYLIDHAHDIYFEGLEKTGLKVEGIPSIEEMNEILAEIGWAAVSVDGFIPPAAFMEFQAHKVLVIAADMRPIDQIEYTPSPDIIHEAAGHAPVIADAEYAEYLRLFGEIGSKAISSKKDYELYEAIRKLSVLKEANHGDSLEIEAAEKDVTDKLNNLGAPSEMAYLTRFHWWTVEYGLVGTLAEPKIYGAGLLSSIGEASTCLKPEIKKITYDANAAEFAFDITTKQPQLFVTPDFKTLIDVLKIFADKMAFCRGGIESLQKALECQRTTSAKYSSGLQVSGVLTDIITDKSNNPIYIKTTGQTNLAFNNKELPGHGIDYHKDGFGSPIGDLKNSRQPLEEFSDQELNNLSIVNGQESTLEFESGVIVKGILTKIDRCENKIILMSFENCTVSYNQQILFEPEWGIYDMAVGQSIVSVSSGAADKDAYEQPSTVSKVRIVKQTYVEKDFALHKLYQQLRNLRSGKLKTTDLLLIWNNYIDNDFDDWLFPVELLEYLSLNELHPELSAEIKTFLINKAINHPDLSKLIYDGMFLADNYKQYQHTWTV